jgi:organic hydroperoxide reductase OsmC/OhrA
MEVAMHPFPHVYRVSARGSGEGRLVLESEGVAPLESSAPPLWAGRGAGGSPDGRGVAGVPHGYNLTSPAAARAARIDWSALAVSASGTLDRADGVTAFTAFDLHAALTLAPGSDAGQAEAALQRAEEKCLISNSLKAPVHLTTALLEG